MAAAELYRLQPTGYNGDRAPWTLDGQTLSDVKNIWFKNDEPEVVSNPALRAAAPTLTNRAGKFAASFDDLYNNNRAAVFFPGEGMRIAQRDTTLGTNVWNWSTPYVNLPYNHRNARVEFLQGIIAFSGGNNWYASTDPGVLYAQPFPANAGQIGNAPAVHPDWAGGGYMNGVQINAIQAFKNRWVIAGILGNAAGSAGYDPEGVIWSSLAAFGGIPTFQPATDPAPPNGAGNATLADTTGTAKELARIADQLIVFKDNSCYTITDTGDAVNPFAIQRLSGQAGIITQHAVTTVGNGLVVMGSDSDVYWLDGYDPKSITPTWVRQRLRSIANNALNTWVDNQESWMIVHYDREADEVYVLPSYNPALANAQDEMLVWKRSTDRWTVRSTFQASHMAEFPEFNQVQTGISGPLAASADESARRGIWSLEGPEALAFIDTAYIEKSDMTLDIPGTKLIKRIWVRGDKADPNSPGTAKVDITLQGYQEPGDKGPLKPTAFTTDIDLADPPVSVPCLVKGRYFKLRIESSSGEARWKLPIIDLEYVPAGRF